MKKALLILLLITCSIVIAQTKIKVACIGNSITYGGLGDQSYPQQLGKLLGAHYEVKNFGISGTTLLKKGDLPYWKQSYFTQAKDYNPNIIIIKLGTNDSKPQNWIYKNEFYQDYIDFINEFRKNGKNPQIFVASPCPAFQLLAGINGEIISKEIVPLCDSIRKATNTYLMDFYTPMLDKSAYFPDGVHPNATGYALMAQIAYLTINKCPSGVIRYFESNKASFEKGESVTLRWETTTSTKVYFNERIFNDIDSLKVYPSKTTTYTIYTVGEVKDSSSISVEYYPPGKIKTYNAFPTMLEKDADETTTLSWTTTSGSEVIINGESVQSNGSKTYSPKTTTDYLITSKGDVVESSKVTVKVLEAEKINRSLNGLFKASYSNKYFPIENIGDGNIESAWKSGAEVSPWFYVDLGKTLEVFKVVIKWGNNFAANYFIQAVNESGAISNIQSVTASDGGTDEVTNFKTNAKYVRVLCSKKSNQDSVITVNEFEVYARKILTDIGSENIPEKFELCQNYPNPFNPTTIISYSIPKQSYVKLVIYNLLGKEVALLVNEVKQAGSYFCEWNSEKFKLASGVYFYKLITNNFTQTKKMLLIK